MMRRVRRLSLYEPVILLPLWSVAMQDDEGEYHQRLDSA